MKPLGLDVFARLRFGTRLALGFGLVVVLLLVTGLFALRQADVLSDLTARLYRHPYTVTAAANSLRAMIYGMHRSMKDVAMAEGAAEVTEAAETVAGFHERATADLDVIEDRFLGDLSAVAQLREGLLDWREIRNEVIALARAGEMEAAEAITKGRGAEQVRSVISQINEFESFARNKAAEFMEGAEQTRASALLWLSALLVLATLLATATALLITRSVTRPLGSLRGVMERLSEGDTDVKIAGRGRGDEIGEMAETVEVFRRNAIEKRRAEEQQRKLEEERRAEEESRREQEREQAEAAKARAEELDRLIKAFEEQAVETTGTLSSASSELTATAESLQSVAGNTANQSDTVSKASEEASSNVGTVASAADELTTSISEITRQVDSANGVTRQAVDEVKSSSEKVQTLSGSAQRVGEIVTLITDIADQTNLLALNATIESARAGEAGKGFAVVASEVKSLATQTRKAIEEISQLVAEIQSASGEAVSTMGRIDEVIAKVSEANSTIASAVEQQNGATQEIARNVQSASEGTKRVSEEISGVADGASQTGAAAEQVKSSASELEQMTAELKSRIDEFISGVRAA